MSISARLFSSLFGGFCFDFGFYRNFSCNFSFDGGFFSHLSSNLCFDGSFFSNLCSNFCGLYSSFNFNRRLACKSKTGDESCSSSTSEKFLHRASPL